MRFIVDCAPTIFSREESLERTYDPTLEQLYINNPPYSPCNPRKDICMEALWALAPSRPLSRIRWTARPRSLRSHVLARWSSRIPTDLIADMFSTTTFSYSDLLAYIYTDSTAFIIRINVYTVEAQ